MVERNQKEGNPNSVFNQRIMIFVFSLWKKKRNELKGDAEEEEEEIGIMANETKRKRYGISSTRSSHTYEYISFVVVFVFCSFFPISEYWNWKSAFNWWIYIFAGWKWDAHRWNDIYTRMSPSLSSRLLLINKYVEWKGVCQFCRHAWHLW